MCRVSVERRQRSAPVPGIRGNDDGRSVLTKKGFSPDQQGMIKQEAMKPGITWFSGFCFYHNRMFGGLFVIGILLDTLFRKVSMPLSINWLGIIALGIGLVYALVKMQMDKSRQPIAAS